MFSRFERFLKPTATPEHPEPPAGLLGFLWHFARQAKPLFIALFVVEFFVALTDAAIPWFMGRIVTFVSEIPPDRFLAETWPWLVGMLLVVVVARPCVALTRYLITNQAIAAPFSSLIRWQAHWHVVRQSWSFFQNDFAGRISNRVMQTGPAVRQTLVVIGDRGLVRADLRHHRRGDDGGRRCVAHRPDPRLVRRLHRAALVLRAAHARPLQDQFRSALGADGPHRRQLHQHPDGEAVRAAARRGQLRARRGRPPCRRLPGRTAPADHVRHHPQPAQRAADRRRRRDGAVPVAEGAGRGRRHRDGAAAHAAAHQHVAPDRGADHRPVRGNRHRAGRHDDDRAPAAARRSARRQAARRQGRQHRIRQGALRLRPSNWRARRLLAHRARRARRSAWSAAPAPASRPWSTCCCASSISKRAAS